jgi:hypothetical protein
MGNLLSIWLAKSGAISTLFVPETCYVPCYILMAARRVDKIIVCREFQRIGR